MATNLIDTVKSLSTLLRKVFGDRLDPSAGTFVEMFADDGVMEFPYAIPIERSIEGPEAIAAHLETNAAKIEFLGVSRVKAHETDDPEVMIIEFDGFGESVSTGAPFEQRYISVVRVRSGRIISYVDYWNPISILRTLRGQEFVESLAV